MARTRRSNIFILSAYAFGAFVLCACAALARAATPVDDALRALLAPGPDGRIGPIHGVTLLEPDLVAAFYAERGHAPLWRPAGHTTPARNGPELDALLQAIEDSREHGFAPDAYHARLLLSLRDAHDTRAELDLLATDAFLRLGLARAHGRLDPGTVDHEWFLHPVEIDAQSLLAQLVEGPPVEFVLDALWPLVPEYWRLLEEKRRLAARADAPPVPVSSGPLLKRGSTGPRVAELRARLEVEGDPGQPFDAALETAVRCFQAGAGLVVDGIVGANTLEMLNLTDAERIRRIDVNLERWRWLMRELPATHIEVDVAAYRMRVIDAGAEALAMNVIVGTPFRRTPVFTENMRYLVFNPDWSVPRRIAVQDKLPLLRRDPAALAAQGYEARRAGSGATMQPVDAFDWSAVTARNFDYLLRQRPGPGNALGQVKFILPNPHAVYLHDTPARELFGRGGRAFSSGCIRLEHAMALAEWVLRDQPQWTRARMDEVLASGATTNVLLRHPLPVLVLYFTAAPGPDGTIQYRPDMYGRDTALAAALAGAGLAGAGPAADAR